jgi:hypothetical protein
MTSADFDSYLRGYSDWLKCMNGYKETSYDHRNIKIEGGGVLSVQN